MSPTANTPLLRKPPRGVSRVPTFFRSSIPNRRSILRAFFSMALHMLLELVVPIVIYYVLRNFVPPLLALLLAGLPTAVMVIIKACKEHKVDMMGVLMLLGFRMAMTLAMGLMLIITLIPFHYKTHVLRPFMFYVARQIAISSSMNANVVREHWDWFWNYYSIFRHFLRAITGIWGLALISEFLMRLVLLNTLDEVDDVVYYSNMYMLAVMIVLGPVTVISALLLRHYFNLEQERIKVAERRSEIEGIIARAAAEQQANKTSF
ncbi:unnamed protein product [Rhizopus stolonifer]